MNYLLIWLIGGRVCSDSFCDHETGELLAKVHAIMSSENTRWLHIYDVKYTGINIIKLMEWYPEEKK